MRAVAALLTLTLTLAAAACGGGGPENANRGGATPATNGRPAGSVDRNAHPVFPDADSGADPSVPAEQGGRGFTGEGWQTNTDYDLIGDPRATKGGVFRQAMTDFPATLRYYGPNISVFNRYVSEMVYESLLYLHPTTLDYIPGLATHWQISDDRQTFRFRLNPNARWADGMPVVADDVVATWRLSVDKSLQDPARNLTYDKFETPVAESKYIVRVRAKTNNWQNFLQFAVGAQIGGMFILPAHALKGMTGDTYIKQHNYQMLPGSGPYAIAEQDIERGRQLRFRRRANYWAAGHRRNIGADNFDEQLHVIVRDRNLEFEMFKRGDIDYYFVNRAQMWVEELNFPNIKRGLNQKRKIWNHNPSGVAGIGINTRREPYTDPRVRLALRHLYNRESMVQKLMFNEYTLFDTFFPGSSYENPGNTQIRYNPDAAVKLLAEAGWSTRDANGRLTRNGQPMTLELVYADQASERYHTVFQEDLRRAGITLNLRFTTFETLIKLLDDRAFGLVNIGYTGDLFPAPDQNWLSSLADQKANNNITGFKNARADQIMQAYQTAFDHAQRTKLLQELDGLLTAENHWIFEWTAPYQRIVYWHKFGYPAGLLTRVGDQSDMMRYWWIDAERNRSLDGARRDQNVNLGEGPADDKYWLEYARTETQGAPGAR